MASSVAGVTEERASVVTLGAREVPARKALAAQHVGELGKPFKRYHIGPVWRGENTQRGRYREFLQCDFDTIGTESSAADVETALVIHDTLLAIGLEDFTVRINDRRVLTGLLERLELVERATAVLRALDKLEKIGPDKVADEMVSAAGATPEQAREVLRLTELSGATGEVLDALGRLVAGSERGQAGVAALTGLFETVAAAGVTSGRIALDVSIARGLDYYTGTVYETVLNDLPSIGSVCSGGRYDDLAQLYTKTRLPGVGASLGVDRLLAALEKLGRLEGRSTPADLFLPWFAADRLGDYVRLAARLRAAGVAVELYPEPKRLGQQLKYADRRGHALALIVGEDEWARGEGQLKTLATGAARTVRLGEGEDGLVATVRSALDELRGA